MVCLFSCFLSYCIDIMGTETIIVARTDSEAATLIDTNIDPRDHPFILGTVNRTLSSLNQVFDSLSSSSPPSFCPLLSY